MNQAILSDTSCYIDESDDDFIVSGNRKSISRFWSSNYRALVSQAYMLCHDASQAEDFVSRATLKLLNFVETYDRPLGEVGAFFFIILRNLAIDEHRAAGRAALLFDRSIDVHAEADLWRLPVSGTDIHDRLADRQALAAIQDVLDNAPCETRALFAHRFMDDRSYEEIADCLGISAPSARKRVQKLRARLTAARGDAVTDLPPARLPSGQRVKQRTAAHGL
jgi:RNA polymerase sigma factor (sigma-70 family)